MLSEGHFLWEEEWWLSTAHVIRLYADKVKYKDQANRFTALLGLDDLMGLIKYECNWGQENDC